MTKIISFLKSIKPPDTWHVPVIIIMGIFTGLLFLVFHLANGTSYLSDKPETCVNCHVMYPQFTSWQHSSHARVANCNDCHVPHNNVFSKYLFKAMDGARHTTIFTLRLEPQVIQIKNAGRNVVQENCERCHENLFGYYHSVGNGIENDEDEGEEGEKVCWSCHQEVPHGTVSSLSAFPYARVPQLNPVVPEWLEKALNKK